MCGIVGYVGVAEAGTDVVLEGLRRLEYRGYDSAGIAVVTGREDGAGVETRKKAGKLANLVEVLDADPLPAAATAIGHTRWATHGGPTDANAHPHLGQGGRLALIHNGIVENFAPLRAELLAAGVEFSSETDTEVVAHLVARAHAADPAGGLTAAMRAVCARLEGAFTLLAVHADEPGTIVGARRNSPLVVGLGRDANYLGSDVAAFIAHTREALELGQDQIVTITADDVVVTGGSTSTGTPRPPRRAASPPSWPRRSTTSRRPSRTPCWGAPAPTAGCSWTR
jgi:glucosamine--fructose-6-phosphate aminotransferase (isomerizing)